MKSSQNCCVSKLNLLSPENTFLDNPRIHKRARLVMSEETRDIRIIGVDKEAIKTGSGKVEHWVISFKLSLAPDENWQKNFYEVQKKNADIMKRKLQVTGDAMMVDIFGSDDLQKVLDVLKIEIVEVNAVCEKDYQKRMQLRQELAVLQQKQMDATQKLKDDADRLVF